MNETVKHKLLPLSLTALVLLVDQGVKAFIVKNWPLEGSFIADVFDNGFLYIIHVRNKAIAFSLGHNLPDKAQLVLFVIAPVLVLGFLFWYYLSSRDFTGPQRWAVAGILGGGLGNLADRIFRPGGVVDFVSVKFYGILGMDRFPTFNVADSSIVVCCILFFITIMSAWRQAEKQPKSESA
ncbi:MAG: signal peptidase II [Treponema sp.]|jgi:signal peptidase II|nr:signal peptidase II [Treponema sp.]